MPAGLDKCLTRAQIVIFFTSYNNPALDYISVHACVCVYKKSVNTLWNCETVDRFIR